MLFIHGFLSSSSFWLETIFPEAAAKSKFRMFAVDLLGFGRSPKPANCLYRVKDHIKMIERSVIEPFRLNSFHLVAHSMGCIIALALAAKYPTCVESITLVAPVSINSFVPMVSQIKVMLFVVNLLSNFCSPLRYLCAAIFSFRRCESKLQYSEQTC